MMFWKKFKEVKKIKDTILLIIIDNDSKKEIFRYSVIETPNVGDYIHCHNPFLDEVPYRRKIAQKSYGIFKVNDNEYRQGVVVYVEKEKE